MKRTAHTSLSRDYQEELTAYERWVREREDLAAASIRTYLSDLRHFITWYETKREAQVHDCFPPQGLTTPALTRYRTSLQTVGCEMLASVNRALISLKCSFGWAFQQHLITYDPSTAVKLVGQEESAPRHLDDQEEQRLLAAVTKAGTLRDRVLMVFLLHTELRARELCRLRRDQVKLEKRSGFLDLIGKRNTYREGPLKATARTLRPAAVCLFPSGKTKEALSERALGSLVKKYARVAQLPDVSPHDLRHRFGYRMAESVPLHRLAQSMGHDSLDTTKLFIQGTIHDVHRLRETIAWR